MKKVLITEGLKQTLEVNGSILSGKNIKVFFAASGDEAVSIHRVENVDLIITGLDLPGLDGDEISAVIRDDDALKKVSIIIICDNNDSAILRGEASRANAFLKKPVSPEELNHSISKLLYIAERKDVRITLQVVVKGEASDNIFYATSRNLSGTGILFETDGVLVQGEIIKCSFSVGKSPISTGGEVIRVEKKAPDRYFYGVQFSGINSLSRRRIEKFLEETVVQV
jgi:CheY-like chemotaxis protein